MQRSSLLSCLDLHVIRNCLLLLPVPLSDYWVVIGSLVFDIASDVSIKFLTCKRSSELLLECRSSSSSIARIILALILAVCRPWPKTHLELIMRYDGNLMMCGALLFAFIHKTLPYVIVFYGWRAWSRVLWLWKWKSINYPLIKDDALIFGERGNCRALLVRLFLYMLV